MRILIVDDDADTHEFITPYLQAQGFDTCSAYTGLGGLQMVQEYDPDLVILDIQLPQLDGWEVCQKIRSFSDVPVVIISAVAREEDDMIRGLNLGADDYLTKPLRPNMLKARLQAVLRRSTSPRWRDERRAYVDAHLTVDLYRHQVYVEGQRVPLSALEYRLLEILVSHAGHSVPTLEIVERLWSDAVDDDYARYVRIYVKRLREVIEPDPAAPVYIVTEHGFGYSFLPQSRQAG